MGESHGPRRFHIFAAMKHTTMINCVLMQSRLADRSDVATDGDRTRCSVFDANSLWTKLKDVSAYSNDSGRTLRTQIPLRTGLREYRNKQEEATPGGTASLL